LSFQDSNFSIFKFRSVVSATLSINCNLLTECSRIGINQTTTNIFELPGTYNFAKAKHSPRKNIRFENAVFESVAQNNVCKTKVTGIYNQ